jgi:hypothetical protein
VLHDHSKVFDSELAERPIPEVVSIVSTISVSVAWQPTDTAADVGHPHVISAASQEECQAVLTTADKHAATLQQAVLQDHWSPFAARLAGSELNAMHDSHVMRADTDQVLLVCEVGLLSDVVSHVQ